ncbi:hypothetical protein F4819DRAFT_484362 [Hypoxylon fuscum]|nr:hypothetical protein F4819DRAFT_484362 [Hypoxylon fuscum]
MAIIPEFPGPTVTVRINGQDAKEYDNKETAEHRNENGVKICTKFIECKDDTPFTVHLNVTGDYKWGHRNHSLNIATFIDGEWAKGVFCREYDMYLGDWEKDISERTYKDSAGRFMSQNFQFTGILAAETRGPSHYRLDREIAERIGTIEVKFYRVTENMNDYGFRPLGTKSADLQLSEEALKGVAISHGTGYSAPTQVNKDIHYVSCKTLPEDNGPTAIFRFKYRSKEALFRERVINGPSLSRRPRRFRNPLLEGLSQEEIEYLAAETLKYKKQAASESRARFARGLPRISKPARLLRQEESKTIKEEESRPIKKEESTPIKKEESTNIKKEESTNIKKEESTNIKKEESTNIKKESQPMKRKREVAILSDTEDSEEGRLRPHRTRRMTHRKEVVEVVDLIDNPDA